MTAGEIWVLPASAGTKFTISTTVTSVKFNGVATTVQSTQSFTTVP